MMFTKAERNNKYTFRLNGFSGLNCADEKNCIQDNGLCDVNNMYLSNGTLFTRPAIKPASGSALIGEAFSNENGNISLQDGFAKIYDATDKSGNKRLIIKYASVLNSALNTLENTVDMAFVDENGTVTEIDSIPDTAAVSNIIPFNYNSELYLFVDYGCDNFKRHKAGNTYFPLCYKYSEGDNTWSEVKRGEFYAPLLFINGKPVASNCFELNGDSVEGYNIITNNYKARFDAFSESGCVRYNIPPVNSGTLTVEHTDAMGILSTHTVELSITKTTVSGAEGYLEETQKPDGCRLFAVCNANECYFTFVGSDNLISNGFSDEDGLQNNITVCYTTNEPTEKERQITLCKAVEDYGGTSLGINGGVRKFFAGNLLYKNILRYSDINNPFYCPENCYICVGDNNKSITSIKKQSNLLIIFKEDEIYYTYGNRLDMEAESTFDTASENEMFPVILIDSTVGCDLPETAVLCQNRLIFASSDGKVYLLGANDQYSRLNVIKISALIENKLSEGEIDNACAVSYKGNYLLFIKDRVFVLNYSNSAISYICSYSSNAAAMKKLNWTQSSLPVLAESAICIKDKLFVMSLYMSKLHYAYNKIYSYCAVYTTDNSGLCDTVYKQNFGFTKAGGAEQKSSVIFFETGGYWDKGTYTVILGGNISGSINGDVTPQIQNIKISCHLQTKLFDFGAAEKRKKIISLSADTACGIAPLRLEAVSQSNEVLFSRKIEAAGREGIKSISLIPQIPAINRIAVKISCEGKFSIKGIVIYYKHL